MVVCVCVMLWGGMIDFMLFWGFADRQTDRLMNKQTFVLLELLSRLKTCKRLTDVSLRNW